MTKPKIQRLNELEAEMRAVARGEKAAPKDAAAPSFNSVSVLMRLLTPENRRLMATIRDKKPQSIAELAKLTGRAPSNLARTLNKLEDAGLVKMRADKKTKFPVPAVKVLRVRIDPFSLADDLELA
jgi:predicted transcriptional regulator